MNPKLKKMITNWRIILLVVLLLFSLVSINPDFSPSGVAITHIEPNSSANIAGIASPSQNIQPREREVITSIFGNNIETLDDYYDAINELNYMKSGDTVLITTTEKTYQLFLKPETQTEVTDEVETILVNVTEEVYSEASGTLVNMTVEKEITRNKTVKTEIGIKDIGIQVKEAPFSNIRKGLDLEGGTRVILEPEGNVSSEDFELIIQHMEQRLDVYGLANIKPRAINDLEGNTYILVEVPGATQEDVKSLVLQQGKFEAKIKNETVFSGSDVSSVLMASGQAGIDPRRGCGILSDGSWSCRFYFGIILTQEAAERQAKATEALNVITTDQQGQILQRENQYLSEQLGLYLDGTLVDALNIGADLKGRPITQIQISGPGTGQTEQEARTDALERMKHMQTLLKTGSLPVSLTLIKTDTISPSLGKEFLDNAIYVGIIALLAVIIIIFIVYRKIQIVLPIAITLLSELVMLLGVSSLFRSNLDMAAIAGIIIVIGTGVDHLIILTDEILKRTTEVLSWVQKLKRAFSIIIVAGLTTIGAMLPLSMAGAGLLRGFAVTTMIGVCIGVLIARPAYSAMIEIFLNK